MESGAENAQRIPLSFFPNRESDGEHDCRLVLTYRNDNGLLRVHQQIIELPILQFHKLMAPVKEAKYKFVVETNCGAVSLKDLFIDIVERQRYRHTLESIVLTFESQKGSLTTIIASKTAGRYRVQSDLLGAIDPILMELETRLVLYSEKAHSVAASLTFRGELPIDAYLETIARHFEVRKRIEDLDADLASGAELYRAIQKKLIAKYKEARSSKLDHFNCLLQRTFDRVLDAAAEMENALAELSRVSRDLHSTTNLLIHLLRLRLELPSDDVRLLESLLKPDCCEELEIGCEEVVERSIQSALAEFFSVRSLKATVTERRGGHKLANTDTLAKSMRQFQDRIIMQKRLTKKA